jgi:hypothetical protein
MIKKNAKISLHVRIVVCTNSLTSLDVRIVVHKLYKSCAPNTPLKDLLGPLDVTSY